MDIFAASITDLTIIGDWYEDHGKNGELIRNLLFLSMPGYGFCYDNNVTWYTWRIGCADGDGRNFGYDWGNGFQMYTGRYGLGATLVDDH